MRVSEHRPRCCISSTKCLSHEQAREGKRTVPQTLRTPAFLVNLCPATATERAWEFYRVCSSSKVLVEIELLLFHSGFIEAYTEQLRQGQLHTPEEEGDRGPTPFRSTFAIFFSSTTIEDNVLLHIPPTHDPPASASGVRELHWYTTILASLQHNTCSCPDLMERFCGGSGTGEAGQTQQEWRLRELHAGKKTTSWSRHQSGRL